MRSLLLNELDNHMTGKSMTFTELRKSREKKIENSIMSLLENTQQAMNQFPKQFYYSPLLVDQIGRHRVIQSYETQLSDLNVGPHCYKSACLSIGNQTVPVLFDFDTGRAEGSASQWIKLLYSLRMDCSISNEYFYYYVMCDAFMVRGSVIENIYQKYIDLLLKECKYGTEVGLLQEMLNQHMINLPYHILQDGARGVPVHLNH